MMLQDRGNAGAVAGVKGNKIISATCSLHLETAKWQHMQRKKIIINNINCLEWRGYYVIR